MPKLDTVFDPRRNALNAVRLVLALSVIVWHSFAITGADIGFAPLRQLASSFSVDAFFTISGFLILSSWDRNPKVVPYLRARVLRIFPAFWACLLLTVIVFAPLALLIQANGMPAGFVSDSVAYVLKNSLLQVNEYSIAGTPLDVPFPGVWNGSMWTLFWEFLCYLGVLALGVATLFRRRWVLPLLLLLAIGGVLLTMYGPVSNFYLKNAAHFGVMFIAGMLVYTHRQRIPVNRWLMLGAAAIILCSTLLPDYRIVSALPIAYLMISLGAVLKNPRLALKNDISYGVYIYAFPLQQLLAVAGLTVIGIPLFAITSMALTIPIAAASWFFLEKPALRLKGIRRPQTVQEVATTAG